MTERVKPHCSVVPDSQRYGAIASRSLRFCERDLVIDVQGSGFAFARLIFRNLVGFRVLDELDLCEFWPEYSDPNGWLWEVHSGGWMDLEKQRPFFISPSVAAPLREFFLVDEYCLSILCQNSPEIIDLGADPRHA